MLALKDTAKGCRLVQGWPAPSSNRVCRAECTEYQQILRIRAKGDISGTTAPPRPPSLDTAVHGLGRYFR
ncbi:hypothetical protein GGI43DRAFT_390041 [Trichoderma evansii]